MKQGYLLFVVLVGATTLAKTVARKESAELEWTAQRIG
jgi:hypothetical protein